MGALGDLLDRLDPDPNRRGKQFERICQWFLTHNPVHAALLRHDRVWPWMRGPISGRLTTESTWSLRPRMETSGQSRRRPTLRPRRSPRPMDVDPTPDSTQWAWGDRRSSLEVAVDNKRHGGNHPRRIGV
jgi:hypothetical protein